MTTVLTGMRADDVPELARLHRSAFPSFFLSQLGEPFLRQFYAGFVDDPTAVVAVLRRSDQSPDPGPVVGVAVGTLDPTRFFRRLLLRRLPGFVAASLRASIRSPRRIPRLLRAMRYRGGSGGGGIDGASDSASGDALLSSICVDPACRGTGAGGDLLDRWAELARRGGGRRAYLVTDAVGNDSTLSFYRAHGWDARGDHASPEGRVMRCLTLDLVERRQRVAP